MLPNIGDNIIYLFSDVLEKKSKLRNFFEKEKTTDIIPCYSDNEITIKKIISNSLKEFNGVSQQILNIIYKSCNNDRMKLYNEIEKIKAYFSEKFINDKDLIELLNLSENENFNYIKDSALNGNKQKTNELLNNTIIEREKSIFYISSINKRLESLKVVSQKKDVNIEKAVTELKPPIFWKDKPNFIQQARLWNINKINVALKKTYDVELIMKSNSNLDNKIVMRRLLIDICLLANA